MDTVVSVLQGTSAFFVWSFIFRDFRFKKMPFYQKVRLGVVVVCMLCPRFVDV